MTTSNEQKRFKLIREKYIGRVINYGSQKLTIHEVETKLIRKKTTFILYIDKPRRITSHEIELYECSGFAHECMGMLHEIETYFNVEAEINIWNYKGDWLDEFHLLNSEWNMFVDFMFPMLARDYQVSLRLKMKIIER